MRKVLLGTTALAAMGLLAGGAAQAEDEAGPISASVGGFYNAAVGFVGGDLGEDKNNTAVGQHINIIVSGSTTLDNGITTGVVAKIEEGQNVLDEYHLFFSGPFGDIKVGAMESAAQQSTNFAPGASGIFGVNSPFFVFTPESNVTTYDDSIGNEDAAKLVYFTPVVNGFRLGASFAPNDSEAGQYGGNEMGSGDYRDHWSVGAEYVADFGEASLRASVGYEGYEYDGTCDNSNAYAQNVASKMVNLSVREKLAKVIAAVDKNGNGVIDGQPNTKGTEMHDAVDLAVEAWGEVRWDHDAEGERTVGRRDSFGNPLYAGWRNFGTEMGLDRYPIVWRKLGDLDRNTRFSTLTDDDGNPLTPSNEQYLGTNVYNWVVPKKYTGGEVQNCQPDALRYGATISAGDFAFGGGVLHSDVSNEHQRIAYDLGLSYSAGAYTLGLQWAHAEEELVTGSIDAMGDMVMGKGDKDTDRYAINGTYVLGPGISLQAQADTGTVAKPGMEEDDWTQVMLGTSISF